MAPSLFLLPSLRHLDSLSPLAVVEVMEDQWLHGVTIVEAVEVEEEIEKAVEVIHEIEIVEGMIEIHVDQLAVEGHHECRS